MAASVRGRVAADPVHPRPAAVRRLRRDHLQPGQPAVRVPRRTGLRQHRDRRRDQPGLAEDPVGAAGGDGGAARHRGRSPARGAAAVPRGGDPEPGRDGRHLPAARGAAGPVPDEAVDRLPGRGGRGRGAARCRRRPLARLPRRGHRHRDRGPADPAGPPGLRRRPALHLRGPAGRRDPRAQAGPGRGQPARRDRADPGGAGVRADRTVAPTSCPRTSRRWSSRSSRTGCCSRRTRRCAASPPARCCSTVVEAVPAPAPAAQPGPDRCGSPTRGYGLLVAGRRCCSAPASGSATRSWPRSAAPPWSRSPGALGVRGLAAAADRGPRRPTPTGSCGASRAGSRCASPTRAGSSARAWSPGTGCARPVRRTGRGTVPVPLVRLRPGRSTDGELPGADRAARASSTSGRWRSAGATRSAWSAWCAGTASSVQVWVRPRVHPIAAVPVGPVPQHGRPGRPGAARQHHLRRAARVRGRRRPAPRALAHLGPGRRADGARARRH